MQFKPFEFKFESFKCKFTVAMVAQECTLMPCLVRSGAALVLRHGCTTHVHSLSAQFSQQSRSLSAVILQYCRCYALCLHCSRALSAVFSHCSRSLHRIVPAVLGSFCHVIIYLGMNDLSQGVMSFIDVLQLEVAHFCS